MNLKACTFEMLSFISLWFGRGAQVGKTSLLEVEFISTAQASTLGVFNFFIWYASGPGIRPKPLDLSEEDTTFFFTMRSKDSERDGTPPRQRSGVASQQRLRLRRFDSTVKRVFKLRFEPISFLFLVCL